MKIEQALVQYLIKFKRLPLQGIGLFELQGAVTENAEGNKQTVIPEDAISFSPVQIHHEEESLVQFVSEATGKIKPLASADLDSYLVLGRQFLNLGNPFIIPGIGTLEKNNQGIFIFKPGLRVADKLDVITKHQNEEDEREAGDENLFNDFKTGTKNKTGKTVLIAVGLLIIALIAWAIWRFAFEPNEPSVVNTTTPVKKDSIPAIENFEFDSSQTVNINPQATQQTSRFRIIVNQYDNLEKATKRYNDLQSYGRNVILYTKDSLTYFVAEPFDLPLADTATAQASLRTYYGPGNRAIDY